MISLVTRRMSSPAPDFPAWAAQFIMDGTRAEVLMVARDRRGEVWLHRKSAWRLSSGTLKPGEEPTACLAREVGEEFGAPLPLVRALAVLRLEMDAQDVLGAFVSHIFLLDAGDHVPAPVADEGITAWRAIPVAGLYAEAARLRALTSTAQPDGWRLPYWGAFRALEHELVADLLLSPDAVGRQPVGPSPGTAGLTTNRSSRRVS